MMLQDRGGQLFDCGGSLTEDVEVCCDEEPPPPPPNCCDFHETATITLTLTDFEYSCSDTTEWQADASNLIRGLEIDRTITLTGVAGTYVTTATYVDCVLGDFEIEIGSIEYRVYSYFKFRFTGGADIRELMIDRTYTGTLFLRYDAGGLRFEIEGQSSTQTGYSKVNGTTNSSDPVDQCFDATDPPPCADPQSLVDKMPVDAYDPGVSCGAEWNPTTEQYDYTYVTGLADVRFLLPGSESGSSSPGGSKFPVNTQSGNCLFPGSSNPYITSVGFHTWADAIEVEIDPP